MISYWSRQHSSKSKKPWWMVVVHFEAEPAQHRCDWLVPRVACMAVRKDFAWWPKGRGLKLAFCKTINVLIGHYQEYPAAWTSYLAACSQTLSQRNDAHPRVRSTPREQPFLRARRRVCCSFIGEFQLPLAFHPVASRGDLDVGPLPSGPNS